MNGERCCDANLPFESSMKNTPDMPTAVFRVQIVVEMFALAGIGEKLIAPA
jgi:hypothetical protein